MLLVPTPLQMNDEQPGDDEGEVVSNAATELGTGSSAQVK
jgi:hypothetical protein